MSTRLKVGAFTLAAAIGVATVAVLGTRADETATSPEANASADTGPSVTVPAVPELDSVPEVDYVIDLNTGEMTPLPEAIIRSAAKSRGSVRQPSGASRYAASPDGSRLAYEGIGDDGSHQIFTAAIDGTEIRQMTHDPARADSPAWSPDATMIAYEGSGRNSGRSLFVLDLASGESTRIADVRSADFETAQFTPDGSSILYGDRIVPIAGGKSTRPRGLHDAGMVSMSPDGLLVTFLGCESGDHTCPKRYVANVDGTGKRLLPGWMSNPAGTWSPDGSRIVCLGGVEGSTANIIVVDIATGLASPATYGSSGAIWLDRHTLLVEV